MKPAMGILLMVIVTLFLGAIIGAFVFGMSGNITRMPFTMTVNDSEKDHIDVYVSNATTKQPLPNVLIGIYNYDKDTLLAGPLYSDESGLVFFETPNGYDDHFRVRVIYNGITDTRNIDKRSIFVRLDEYFGNFSTPLYGAILAIFGGIIAYMKKDYIKSIIDKKFKIGKGKDEL
jgi:hypothetical protein